MSFESFHKISLSTSLLLVSVGVLLLALLLCLCAGLFFGWRLGLERLERLERV